MNLEWSWQGNNVQPLTNPDFEVNFQGVDSHSNGRGKSSRRKKRLGIQKTVGRGRLKISHIGAQRRELGPSRHYTNPGRFRCQSVARSKTRAVRNSFSSANGAARSCRPIGRPALVKPQGMLIPGMPARLAVIV